MVRQLNNQIQQWYAVNPNSGYVSGQLQSLYQTLSIFIRLPDELLTVALIGYVVLTLSCLIGYTIHKHMVSLINKNLSGVGVAHNNFEANEFKNMENEESKHYSKKHGFIYSKKSLIAIATIILVIAVSLISISVLQSNNGSHANNETTLGFMGNAEQASITKVLFNSNTQVTVTIQNTGSTNVTIVTATIDGNTVIMNPLTLIVNEGNTGTVTLTSATAFVNSAQYTISLTTAKGNTLTSAATCSIP